MNRMPYPIGPAGVHVAGDSALGWFHVVLWFVLWVLVIVAAVWVVRLLIEHFSRPRPVAPPVSPALAELELRYARGEITREEYFTRRADLAGMAPPQTPPSA